MISVAKIEKIISPRVACEATLLLYKMYLKIQGQKNERGNGK